MEEIFTLNYIKETKNFRLQVNKDFLVKYGVTDEMFKENFNYELINNLKDHICDIARKGIINKRDKRE